MDRTIEAYKIAMHTSIAETQNMHGRDTLRFIAAQRAASWSLQYSTYMFDDWEFTLYDNVIAPMRLGPHHVLWQQWVFFLRPKHCVRMKTH